jgi:hypothetical protein
VSVGQAAAVRSSQVNEIGNRREAGRFTASTMCAFSDRPVVQCLILVIRINLIAPSDPE